MRFKIKEARERAGYSQKELASIIGVAPNTFHGYESGKHDPKSDYLQKIAMACDVSVDFLLGVSESPNKKEPASSTGELSAEETLRQYFLTKYDREPSPRDLKALDGFADYYIENLKKD